MTLCGRPIALVAMTLALALTSGCGKGGQSGGGQSGGGQSGGQSGGGQDEAGAPSPTQNAPAPTMAAAAPPPAFAVCSSCHAVVPGQNRIGPSLAGVYGRKAASLPGYAYSPALKNSGIVWGEASLDRWLQGPIQMVPGSKMVIGLSDPQGRKSVIDYLKTLK